MLATSQSPNASTFKIGSFKNGSSSIPVYQSSPRSCGPPSRRSPLSIDVPHPSISTSPPLRANYQNASTQYSPMGDASHTSPLIVPAKEENCEAQDPKPEVPFSRSATTCTNPAASSSEPAAEVRPPQTPRTKRRQFKETAESGSSSTTAQTSPPKRTKPAKSAAKVLPVKYELCAVEDMVILIADLISELIETNDNLPLRDVVLTRFHSRSVQIQLCYMSVHTDLPAERLQEYQLLIIFNGWLNMPH
jgi:hypothetical protein